MQTRLGSMIEAWANVLIGFGIQFTAAGIGLHLLGLPITMAQNLKFGLFMTAISLVRSYLLRRLFNKLKAFHRGTKTQV